MSTTTDGHEQRRAAYRDKRKRLGLTQTELGAQLGVHWTTICRRERGSLALTREAELALDAVGRSKSRAKK